MQYREICFRVKVIRLTPFSKYFFCSYVRLLVVDLCFLIEAQSEEELPVSRTYLLISY